MGRVGSRKGQSKKDKTKAKAKAKPIERLEKKAADSVSSDFIEKKGSSKIAQNRELCFHCHEGLARGEHALLVEEEVGRVFCSEECIANYFTPEIEKMEKEYFSVLRPGDLDAEEKEALSHLRWQTLENPNEIWRTKSVSGDAHYVLISEFAPMGEPVWCVCVCLYLRNEPSFLFIAFTTRSPEVVDHYRKGDRDLSKSKIETAAPTASHEPPAATAPAFDGLAGSWTRDETLRAQVNIARNDSDISPEEFDRFQPCMDVTLETPDEVWVQPDEGKKVFHFIRQFAEMEGGVWYIVVAKETDDEEQIEILDAFPSRDQALVERMRVGKQEIGIAQAEPVSRLIH